MLHNPLVDRVRMQMLGQDFTDVVLHRPEERAIEIIFVLGLLDQVINGDCLTVLPQLPDASVDLVLTDPPYLVRYQSRDGRRLANDDSDAWLVPAFAQAYRVLRR